MNYEIPPLAPDRVPTVALVTTTINVPEVLHLYRAHGPDVQFFVTGDHKTPHEQVRALCDSIGNARYYDVQQQVDLGYKVCPLIGWNTIGRRNVALLEALKHKPDIVVTIDDDNIPLGRRYFTAFRNILRDRFDGLAMHGQPWLDVGTFLTPFAPHRGIPVQQSVPPPLGAVISARIGVAAGICLGDPDTRAVDRIAASPSVQSVSTVLDDGLIAAPDSGTWSVFNTQNTAFLSRLAPALFCPPGIGRYDDIFASVVCQWWMKQFDLRLHFGQPFVWQERNAHDLVKDLEQELWGMKHLARFTTLLDTLHDFRLGPVLALRDLYTRIGALDYFPPQVALAGQAWLDDVEKVL